MHMLHFCSHPQLLASDSLRDWKLKIWEESDVYVEIDLDFYFLTCMNVFTLNRFYTHFVIFYLQTCSSDLRMKSQIKFYWMMCKKSCRCKLLSWKSLKKLKTEFFNCKNITRIMRCIVCHVWHFYFFAASPHSVGFISITKTIVINVTVIKTFSFQMHHSLFSLFFHRFFILIGKYFIAMIKKYHIFCEIINKRTKASAKYGKTFLDNAHKALPIIKMKNAKN